MKSRGGPNLLALTSLHVGVSAVDEQNAQTLEQGPPPGDLTPEAEPYRPLLAQIRVTSEDPASSGQEDEEADNDR